MGYEKSEYDRNVTAPLVNSSDLLPSIKSSLKENWQQERNCIYIVKGSFFYGIKQKIITQPWFHNLNFIKKTVSTISRMRLNRCSTPVHLHSIQVRRLNLCGCGEVGDLPHLLFESKNYFLRSILLYISRNFKYITKSIYDSRSFGK